MEDYLQQLCEKVQQILKIDSVKSLSEPGAPFGRGAREALDFMLGLGSEFGFTVKNVEGYAGHIEWGTKGKILGILTHLDVVPAGSDWTVPPFGGVCQNGYIYGRGAQDDKAPALAVLYAMKSLKDEGVIPNCRVRLIMGCDEESGWSCIRYYFEHESMPDFGFSPDGDFPVINCEKGVIHLKAHIPFGAEDNFSLISLRGGERVNMVPDQAACVYRLNDVEEKVQTKGISSHGSQPAKGQNALFKLFKYLHTKTSHAVIERINTKLCSDTMGESLGMAFVDEKSGALTINFGTCAYAGGEIICGLDIRYPVTKKESEVLAALQVALPEASLEVCNTHPALWVDPNLKLVQTLLDAYRKVMKCEAGCIAIGGATYARAIQNCVAFGPVFPGTIPTLHMADERISLVELEKLFLIYREAIQNL